MNRYRVLTSVLALTAAVLAASAGAAGASSSSHLRVGVTPQHCTYHGDQKAMSFNNIVVVKDLSCRAAVRAINIGHFSDRAFKFSTRGFDCTASGHSGGVAHKCVEDDGPGRFYFDTAPD